jgi:hypothetical protein
MEEILKDLKLCIKKTVVDSATASDLRMEEINNYNSEKMEANNIAIEHRIEKNTKQLVQQINTKKKNQKLLFQPRTRSTTLRSVIKKMDEESLSSMDADKDGFDDDDDLSLTTYNKENQAEPISKNV